MKKYKAGQSCLVMTRDEVRAFDAWAINELGIPGVVLMENAGRSCAELILEKFRAIKEPRVTILCGLGNNGGDGFVIARHLLNHRFDIRVLVFGDSSRIKGDARVNFEILKRLGQEIIELSPDTVDCDTITTYCKDASMLVDALFGTGLRGQLDGNWQRIISCINSQHIPILAVDIPSGLDCDTAEVLGQSIKATYTVTFVAVKKGFTIEASRAYTGSVYVASIGVDPIVQLPNAPGRAD